MRAERDGERIRVYDAFSIKECLKDMNGSFDAEDKAWCVQFTQENLSLLKLIGVQLDEKLIGMTENRVPQNSVDCTNSAPMPIKGTPYKHQRSAFCYAMNLYEMGRCGAAILADMGTGKTLITIAVAGALYRERKINRLLIVAPKSIVGVWREEFEKFAGFDFTLCVLEGDGRRKADTVRNMTGSSLQIVVVNYESAWRLETELKKWQPDMIVCDEASKIKNAQAKQSKALHNLGRGRRYKAILTGTPISNSPLDLFSQYKFLDDSVFGLSYYQFRAKYAVIGGYQNHQIIGYRNLPELMEKAHNIAFRIKIEDAVELPDKIDESRMIELEPKAQEIYRGIDRESYAQLIQGEITTTNVLTRLLRLSQCTGGFIRDDADGFVQQVSAAKLDALEDILDASLNEEKKVVVFAQYLPELNAIEKLLKSKKIGYSLISGAVKDRMEQVRRFQEDSEVKVFIGQLATTGMGLTLTAATVAVFYSLSFSYENYKQSRARIHRIGQTKKCLYIHLIAKDTVDEKVMAALQHKGDVARFIIDDFKKHVGESNGRKQEV